MASVIDMERVVIAYGDALAHPISQLTNAEIIRSKCTGRESGASISIGAHQFSIAANCFASQNESSGERQATSRCATHVSELFVQRVQLCMYY